jgi:hypothetical protein
MALKRADRVKDEEVLESKRKEIPTCNKTKEDQLHWSYLA